MRGEGGGRSCGMVPYKGPAKAKKKNSRSFLRQGPPLSSRGAIPALRRRAYSIR